MSSTKILHLDPTTTFEASPAARQTAYATRTQERNHGGVAIPGAVGVSGLGADLFLFGAGLAAEAYGVAAILSLGSVSVLIALAVFAIEVICAVCHHAPISGIKRNKNALVNADPNDRARIVAQIQGAERWRSVWSLPIIALAVLKLLVFLVFSFFALTPFSFAVAATYALVAYIHLRRTGFVAAAAWAWWRTGRDYRRWLGGGGGQQAPFTALWRSTHFASAERLTEGTAGPHFLTADGSGKWILWTHGVLTDAQIDELVLRQTTHAARAAIARVAVKHQDDVLHTVGGMLELPQHAGATVAAVEMPHGQMAEPSGATAIPPLTVAPSAR